MSEEWRPIEGWEGKYEVSNLGRVKSLERVSVRRDGQIARVSERILKPMTPLGYHLVALREPGRFERRQVHRLVATAFNAPGSGPFVLHWNGDRADNRIENLRWGTQRENVDDTMRHGRVPHGEKHHSAKLTAEKVVQIRGSSETCKQASRRFGVSPATICLVRNKKVWAWLEAA